MKVLMISILILFSHLSNFSGQEQEMRFHHLTVDDGLSQNWITSIIQDSYGFLWVGTGGNGINRYDGYEFVNYKKNENNNLISNNYVTVIFEDSKKRLLAGTSHGLNIYDRDNDRFIPFTEIKSDFVTGISEFGDSLLIVVCELNIFEIKQDKAIRFIRDKTLPNLVNGQIVRDKRNNYWLATNSVGIFNIDVKTKTFKLFQHKANDVNSISSNRLSFSYLDNKGDIWLGTVDNGLSQIKYREDSSCYFKNFYSNGSVPNSITPGTIRSILDDNQGHLWIGPENGGLDIMDMNTNVFRNYQNNLYDNMSLSNNSIYCMYKDKQGTIWLGTYGAGINYYNKLLFQFEHYKPVPGNNKGLSNGVVNVFFEDKNELWIGTEGGLNYINRKTGEYKLFQYSIKDKNTISSNAIWSIFKDSKGQLWVGTWGGGLNLLDKQSGTFSHFYHNDNDPESIGGNNIFGIIEHNNYLYLATMGGGMSRYDFKTGKFKTYNYEWNKTNQPPSRWLQGIYKTSKNEILLITVEGISFFDPQNETFTNYYHDKADEQSIINNTVNDFLEDSKHNYWFATEEGISLYISKDNKFVSFTEKDGLCSNSVKSICEDKNGNLWIGTNNGLSEFINAVNVPEKPVFRNFSKVDGLQGNEFCRKASLAGSDGKLYFGGYNGFNAFYPDSIKGNSNIPEIVITDFLLFNKKVEIGTPKSPLKKNITLTKELVLNYDQYVFTFKYAALNYLYPQKNQYKYIMEGFEKEWNNVGTKREATYTNLSPGKYTFKVIGSNNNNIWNEKGASIMITILPPWWKAWWFKISLVLTIIASGYLFYNIRLNLYKKRQKELTLLVAQRTKDLEEKNNLLLQRQAQIEKQDEEIRVDSAILKEANELLYERQIQIEKQTEQLKESNIQLSLLNATKDRFFSIIAHDLRNPFNVVSGFSEILLRNIDKMPKEKVQKFLNMIFLSSTSGNNLLENLLQWSRSQTGRINFEPERLNLSVIAEETLRILEVDAHRKSIEINQLIDTNINVMADENMIKTVLRNLISNAIKFTAETGIVTLSAKVSDAFVEIIVSDTGTGIPEETMQKLFRVDVIVTTKGTAKESGTGLGLILCKDFVERHNGKIWVESTLGKGSDFKFTIPSA